VCHLRSSTQPHLKGVVVDRAMESFVLVALNIGENLIPCVWMLRVVHVKYMNDHMNDELCRTISLGVEVSVFGELGVQ
jgi:hypothetical protein